MQRTVSNAEPSVTSSQLARCVAELAERLQAGEPVDVRALCVDCPEHLEQLEMLLPTLEAVIDLEHSLADDAAAKPTDRSRTTDAFHGLLGDFRLIRELGRGGMGVVYEAEQLSLGRRVALKVLPFAAMLDKQQLARFKNEARAAATLDHPNIVAIHSVGTERGVHYYAMQLIEGQSLAQMLEEQRAKSKERSVDDNASPASSLQRGLLGKDADATTAHRVSSIQHPASNVDTAPVAALSTLPDFGSREYYRYVARLGIQAAEALDHAHQTGVLHRDVKPGNLMVDDAGKLWVTDFGLARIEQDAGMTMTGDLIGTLRYMSPEQALAKRVVVDHRSDIYSLGVTVYELLTLRPAFRGEDRHELLRQIAFEEPRRLRHINSRIPVDLETVVLKAMEKNSPDRYDTAQALANDFKRFASDLPIQARPPKLHAILRKWTTRHRTAANVIACCLLLLLMAAIAVAADHRRKIRDATRFVEISLDAAQAAFVAEDIPQAAQRLAEAQTRMDSDRVIDAVLRKQVSFLERETKRYQEFQTLVKQARRTRANAHFEHQRVNHALSLYGVTKTANWLKSLRDAGLLKAHTDRVRAGVYELLLVRADLLTRWPLPDSELDGDAALRRQCPDALACLQIASTVRGPSRGYYWLLANCARINGDEEKASRLRKLALESPVDHASELFYVSRDFRFQRAPTPSGGDYTTEEVLADYREMLRFDPTFINALYFMGMSLSNEKRFEASLMTMYACLVARPDDRVALGNCSEIHRELGQYSEAIECADKLISAAPEQTYGRLLRAYAYKESSQFEKAIVDFERVLEIEQAGPRDDQPQFIWGSLRETLRKFAMILAAAPDERLRNGPRAVELATKACRLADYKDPAALDVLAAAYAEVKDFKLAIELSEKALNLAKDEAMREKIQSHLKVFRRQEPWRLE